VLCIGGRIRDAQLLPLNGRPLERTSELHHLIEASYARLHRRLAGQTSSPGSAPAVFCISLTCCPSRYDAAFHKEKSEVMFYDLASVRNALLGALTSFFCRDPRDIAAELVLASQPVRATRATTRRARCAMAYTASGETMRSTRRSTRQRGREEGWWEPPATRRSQEREMVSRRPSRPTGTSCERRDAPGTSSRRTDRLVWRARR